MKKVSASIYTSVLSKLITEIELYARSVIKLSDISHPLVDTFAAYILLEWCKRHRIKISNQDYEFDATIKMSVQTPQEIQAMLLFFSRYANMDSYLLAVYTKWSGEMFSTLYQYAAEVSRGIAVSNPQLESSYNNRLDAGDEWMHE